MPFYELTQANSSRVVPLVEDKTCVVLHRMNGCIHCEMFKPTWKQVCDKYKNQNHNILIDVEYSSMNLLPETMRNVQGFPTLRAYKNAKPIAEFNDTRTYDAVIEFIEKYGNNGNSGMSSPSKVSKVSKSSSSPKASPKASSKASSKSSPSKPSQPSKKQKK